MAPLKDAVGEQLRRHERVRRAALDDHEHRQRGQRRRPARPAAPASPRPRAASSVSDQVSAPSATAASTVPGTSRPRRRLRVAGLGHVPQRDDHDEHGQRQVEQEHRPPAPLDQPAAEERADRPGDPAEPGPRADRRAPGPAPRNDAGDQREAARRQQRPADALQRAAPRSAAPGSARARTAATPARTSDADDEHAAASEVVAQRAAEQDQRGQREGVGVDGPLQAGEPGVQVRADRRRARR